MSVETITLVAAIGAALTPGFVALLFSLNPRIPERKVRRIVRDELARIERETAQARVRLAALRAWESHQVAMSAVPDYSPADYRRDTAQVVDGPIVPEWMVRELNVAPDEAFTNDPLSPTPSPAPETRPMTLLSVEGDEPDPRLTRYMPTGRPINGKEK